MQDSIADPVNAFFDGQDHLSRFIEKRVEDLEGLTAEAAGDRPEAAGEAAETGIGHDELKAVGWPGGEDEEASGGDADGEQGAASVAKAAAALRLPSDRELDALFPVENLTL